MKRYCLITCIALLACLAAAILWDIERDRNPRNDLIALHVGEGHYRDFDRLMTSTHCSLAEKQSLARDAMIQAVHCDNERAIERVVKQYPDLGEEIFSDALSQAAGWGRADSLNALLKSGIDPDLRCSESGWTALHYAASRGQFRSVCILLDYGADMDAVGPTGKTPADVARSVPELWPEAENVTDVMMTLDFLNTVHEQRTTLVSL